MKTCVALLRGINVGGKNLLPMKELVAMLEGLGATGVRTYLQSGNAVFDTAAKDLPGLAGELAAEIRKRRGFEPCILVLGLDAIEDAIRKNPFPEAEADPKSLHVGFLAHAPKNPDMARLESLRKTGERFRLIGSVFYLHAPEGVGRSRLAASAEKLLGVPMTDRNWQTVCKVQELAEG